MKTGHKAADKFTGGAGFIFAAAGSAVGLGNIWRFPYLAAQYGGGIFLLTYLILTLTFGFSLMTLEAGLGRRTGRSCLGCFADFGKKYAFIGWIPFVVSLIILPYYCVIGGWVLRYLVKYITGAGVELASESYFYESISEPVVPVVYTALFLGVTAFVLSGGVRKGVERFSKIMMPVLVILAIATAVYSVMLPGAAEGVKYLFFPRISQFSPMTVLAALGQMFYSLSLSMGIMITYGAYLPKKENLEKCVGTIEIFDTGIAVLSALMVIPAVFAFTGGEMLYEGPGLLFTILPGIFANMSWGGAVGAVFFLLVFIAALTSAVSMMEAVVWCVTDKFGIKRKKAVVIIGIATALLSIPASLGYGVWSGVSIFGFNILDFMDFITNSVLMPVGAFFACWFVGWIAGTKTVSDEVKLSGNFKRERLFNVMVKYIAPVLILAVLAASLAQSLGFVKL